MKNYIKERSRIIFKFSSHKKFYECECKLNFQFMTVQNRNKIFFRKQILQNLFEEKTYFIFIFISI